MSKGNRTEGLKAFNLEEGTLEAEIGALAERSAARNEPKASEVRLSSGRKAAETGLGTGQRPVGRPLAGPAWHELEDDEEPESTPGSFHGSQELDLEMELLEEEIAEPQAEAAPAKTAAETDAELSALAAEQGGPQQGEAEEHQAAYENALSQIQLRFQQHSERFGADSPVAKQCRVQVEAVRMLAGHHMPGFKQLKDRLTQDALGSALRCYEACTAAGIEPLVPRRELAPHQLKKAAIMLQQAVRQMHLLRQQATPSSSPGPSKRPLGDSSDSPAKKVGRGEDTTDAFVLQLKLHEQQQLTAEVQKALKASQAQHEAAGAARGCTRAPERAAVQPAPPGGCDGQPHHAVCQAEHGSPQRTGTG